MDGPQLPPVMRTGRPGFTLVEMLAAMTILGIVLLTAFQVMESQSDFVRYQSAKTDASQVSRITAAVLAAELREVDPTEGDLIEAEETWLTVRTMRKLGFACNVDSTNNRIDLWVLSEPFATDDEVTIFRDSLLTSTSDDGWIYHFVTATDSIPNTVTTCGGNGWTEASRQRLTLDAAFIGINRGAQVRSWIASSYGLYEVDGEYVFGREDDAGTVEAMIGPLTEDGLTFVYMDSAGTTLTPTTDELRQRVRRIGVTVRGVAGTDAGATDSVVTQIYLRNH